MKRETFIGAVSRIDDAFLEEALQEEKKYEEEKKAPRTAGRTVLRVLVAAAAALLTLGVIFASGAALEARQFRKAEGFFAEYGLSTEGLSRSEILAVYGDIESERFTLTVTRDVIVRSISAENAERFELNAGAPSPGRLREAWIWRAALPVWQKNGMQSEENARYSMETDAARGATILSGRTGAGETWQSALPGVTGLGYLVTGKGLFVYGYTDSFAGYVAMLRKEDGTLLWSDERARYDMKFEFLRFAFLSDDGSVAVLGECRKPERDDYVNDLVFVRYDDSGKILNEKRTSVPGNAATMTRALRFQDGYLVQMRRAGGFAGRAFLQVDETGDVREFLTYEMDGKEYAIEDAAEFDGKFFLSVTALPKTSDPALYGREDGIAAAAKVCLNAARVTNATKEQTENALRNGAEAMLLIVLPEDASVCAAYSLKGALGGSVTIEEETLLWNAETLLSVEKTDAGFSAQMASRRFGFAKDGSLTDPETDGIPVYTVRWEE